MRKGPPWRRLQGIRTRYGLELATRLLPLGVEEAALFYEPEGEGLAVRLTPKPPGAVAELRPFLEDLARRLHREVGEAMAPWMGDWGEGAEGNLVRVWLLVAPKEGRAQLNAVFWGRLMV